MSLLDFRNTEASATQSTIKKCRESKTETNKKISQFHILFIQLTFHLRLLIWFPSMKVKYLKALSTLPGINVYRKKILKTLFITRLP